MKPGYLDICYVHWMWSQVCRSRKSRCRWPRSELHLRLHTPSCYCDSHSALCLRARKRAAGGHADSYRGCTLPMWQIHCGPTYLSYCSWLHQSHSPHSHWSSCSAELSWCNGHSSTRTRPFGTLVWKYSLLEENKSHREVIFNMLHVKN